ncbi:MAG: DNA-binding response regulator [Caldiserica bacterium]|nr:MAG: DNA-binding response regulator [Caldisericota bacterium]
MREKILIIDDDHGVLKLMKYVLEREKFSVVTCSCGEDGIEKARESKPDLIILDLKLPDMHGLDILKILKKDKTTSYIPVIILTAQGKSEMDVVRGLEMGAEDYIVKPPRLREFVSRVRVVLRRLYYNGEVEDVLERGMFYINLSRNIIKVNGQEIKGLTQKEFDLLCILIRKSGQVLKHEYLLETVWGYESNVNTQTLKTHIKNLRRKLPTEAKNKIQTIRGIGYRLEE